MASAKGGSGKTSLVATFATFLSKLEKKILLIDSDFATNGLTLLYLKEMRVKSELIHSTARAPIGLFEGLNKSSKCDIVELGEYLHLIPATFGLQSGASSAASDSTRLSFQALLSPLREVYDYIFIDAQAGADDMAQIAMSRRVSDEVVIVSEYDPMSAAGVERLKALLREDLTYDRTWVLLNKILPEFAKSFSDFLEVAKYLNPIPWDAEVVRAYARRRLAIDSDTGNEHTLSVLQTLRGLCGDSIQEQLAAWLQSRAAVIRQPLEKQYSDAEKEMAYLLSRRSQIERKKQLFRLIAAFTLIVGTLTLGTIGYLKFQDYIGPKELLLLLLAVGGILVVFFTTTDSLTLFRIFSGGEGIQVQLDEARYDRQLELLKERLKRLELLRTLDPETLLQRSDLRPGDPKARVSVGRG